MTTLTFTAHKRIKLKGNPELNEKWLQGRIAHNPGIIGLGEIEILDRERQQDRAGRQDLLLADTDTYARFEVELILGPDKGCFYAPPCGAGRMFVQLETLAESQAGTLRNISDIAANHSRN